MSLKIRHYKFNDDKDDHIQVLDKNDDSDSDDDNVVLKSVCKDMSVNISPFNDVRTCQ